MATHDFSIAGGGGEANFNHFVNFAEGDPYYLDFSEGGQQGTISWSMDQVNYKRNDKGFSVTYDPKTQEPIFHHITTTVEAYHGSRTEHPHHHEG